MQSVDFLPGECLLDELGFELVRLRKEETDSGEGLIGQVYIFLHRVGRPGQQSFFMGYIPYSRPGCARGEDSIALLWYGQVLFHS